MRMAEKSFYLDSARRFSDFAPKVLLRESSSKQLKNKQTWMPVGGEKSYHHDPNCDSQESAKIGVLTRSTLSHAQRKKLSKEVEECSAIVEEVTESIEGMRRDLDIQQALFRAQNINLRNKLKQRSDSE